MADVLSAEVRRPRAQLRRRRPAPAISCSVPAVNGFTSFTDACSRATRFYYAAIGVDKAGRARGRARHAVVGWSDQPRPC